jgi:molybdate transport system substrate-binding protein
MVALVVATALMLIPRQLLVAPAATQTQPALQIAAASDLRFSLEEIARLFQVQRHVQVRLTFGSSGQLATQIEQGAPFDVFFSADEAFANALSGKGLILKDTVQLYAIGRIVLWSRADFPVDVRDGLGVLVDARVRFVAIANPEHAPYGRAAVEVLRSAGLSAQVQPKLVLGENISQALQMAQTGNADVGIVAFSLAIAPAVQASGRYWLIPAYLHHPIRQAVGVVAGSRQQEVARAFVAFVNGPAGRAVMRRYGFTLPGEGL